MRDIERLVECSAMDPTAKDVVWTKTFFAVWNDETAEKHARDGITAAVRDGRYGDLSYLYIGLVFVLIRASRVRDAQAALEESDRLGAWAGSSLQEDMARIVVKEYSGDLDGARELARSAVERSRAGSKYWFAGFMAQVAFIETSARNLANRTRGDTQARRDLREHRDGRPGATVVGRRLRRCRAADWRNARCRGGDSAPSSPRVCRQTGSSGCRGPLPSPARSGAREHRRRPQRASQSGRSTWS